MIELKEVLKERNNVHGDFTENAQIQQELLGVLVSGSSYHKLDAVKITALQYICGKLSRIVSGDPEYADHWLDLTGYSQLVVDRTTQSRIEKDKENANSN